MQDKQSESNRSVARIIAAVSFLSVVVATWMMLLGTIEKNGNFTFALIVFTLIGIGAIIGTSTVKQDSKGNR